MTGSLHYCIVEHSGLDPYELIDSIVKGQGIIVLSLDHYEMKGNELDSTINFLKKKGIKARRESGNLWIDEEEAPKFNQPDAGGLEGNEYIFTANQPKVQLSSLGYPLKGWHKNKLKDQVYKILEQNLQGKDLYACDDYSDCLFISKSESVILSIASNVKSFKNIKEK